ncbi:MAG: rhomboid family intramembrane serine protease [Bacteroidota bacterium]|jgi:membrane associated rhomboid family serine protease
MEQYSGINVLTFGLIGFTVLFSFLSFGNESKLSKYAFTPYLIKNNREHYRFLSHAFIHADEMHLFFNMLGLYFFGTYLEDYLCIVLFGPLKGRIMFLVFYTTAIYAASLPQYFRQRNSSNQSSLGASGAVNAIVFAYIMVNPTSKLSFFLIPIGIPAWIFGIFYLGMSYYLSKRKNKNGFIDMIDHSAHFWGALYGIIFMIALEPELLTDFFLKILG